MGKGAVVEFAEQKRGLINALTNTFRTSRLVDMINAQEAVAVFAMVLDRQAATPNNAAGFKPLDIAQFYEWLTGEKKLPKDVVAETLLFLKSRELRYQVDLVLPKEVTAIDEVTRMKIIQEFIQRGASTSGIYQGVNPAGAARDPSGPTKPAPGASGSKPATPPAKSSPYAQKKKQGGSVALLAVLGIVAVSGAGLTIYMQQTAPRSAPPLTADVPGALPCAPLTGIDGYAVCRITTEQFAALPPLELAKAAAITKKECARQGQGNALTVITREDNKVRGAF